MNPVTEDIKDLLSSSSVALGTFADDLFISEFPDSPNLCICLRDTSGWKPGETNYDLDYPGLQVLVRGDPSGYMEAYDLLQNIKNELHAKTNFRQGAYYISLAIEGDIMYIGRDKKNRPLFSANFLIMRRS